MDEGGVSYSVLTEISLGWVAGILTPHALKVCSADGAIDGEHTIQLGVVGHYQQN